MTTRYINLRGKTKWFRPDRLSQYNKWEHQLYPIPEDVDKILELKAQGLKNNLRKDDEGYNINIGRPPELKVNGAVKALQPPVVTITKDGIELPYTGLVGNGSDITTTVEVYNHRVPGSPGKKAVAWRWLSTRIDNLVPFQSEEMRPEEQKAVEHHSKTPVPTWR